jgi:hypothetical protein
MRILAIDPGNEMSAWCELEDGKRPRHDKVTNEVLLASLRNHATAIWKPDVVAIEMIASYGMAVGREVFETCLWIGRFQEAWEARGGTVRLVYRKDVKLHHCQTVRATDANIRAALIDRYGPGKERAIGKKAAPGPLFGIKGDEWAALAVALTASETRP